MVDYKPKVRGGFSDRNKQCPINTIIQKDNLDERTRNAIVNLVDFIIEHCERNGEGEYFYQYVYKTVFCLTSDDIPSYESAKREKIVNGIKTNWKYYDVFSFLEAILEWYDRTFSGCPYYVLCNNIFKRECVGYRFIDGKIVYIIDPCEIDEIEEALNIKYTACKKCIKKALNLLYDRDNPDYSNSVKESISSIEAMCNIILGTKNVTLGQALNKMEESGLKIHSAMKNAYKALYGYTSDKSGIRHNSGLDENTTFEEAKYMLVSCSAFLNYLIQIYEKYK